MGHNNVSNYAESTRRLVKRFDRKDPEAPFIILAKLKQTGDADAYISEFLRLSVMVLDLSVARRVYMFIDGLEEPLHGSLSLPSPSLYMMPLRELDISKMPCQGQRQPSQAKPLTLLRGKRGKLLHPRRAH